VCGGARARYDTDLTDAQWAVLAPLMPVAPRGRVGRPLRWGHREVVNTILYVLRTGCAWRLVPHDLVPGKTAYRWFRVWAADGTWDRVHDELRDRVRMGEGRDGQPSAAVIDAQSVLTAEGGAARGYDAGKRTRGRKRHLLVDTLGLVLAVHVTSASVQDRLGARPLLDAARRRFPLLGLVWADQGYANRIDSSLLSWASRRGLQIEIVTRPQGVTGFHVLPRRWVVERTFGWLGRCRRLGRDHERKPEHAEAMIKIAMIRLMAARLAGEDLEPIGPIETEAAQRLDHDTNPNQH
jgi:transposase